MCVDAIGLVRGPAITPANVADCKGARPAVTEAACAGGRLTKVWADSAFQGFVEFALLLLELAVPPGVRHRLTEYRKPAYFEVNYRDYVHQSHPLSEATRQSLMDDLELSDRDRAA